MRCLAYLVSRAPGMVARDGNRAKAAPLEQHVNFKSPQYAFNRPDLRYPAIY